MHEAGHVVAAHLLGLPPAERATITLAGGFIDLPSTPLETRSSALNRVAAVLGGRAAEELLLGESSNGAGLGKGSDLEMATQLVGRMLFEWGLGDQLMHAAHSALPAGATDKIEPLLQAAHIRAAEIIEMQRPLVIKLAEDLLSERELPSERPQELLQYNQRTRPPS